MSQSLRRGRAPQLPLTVATLLASGAGAGLALLLVGSERRPGWFPAVPILLVGLLLIVGAAIVLILTGSERPVPPGQPNDRPESRPPRPLPPVPGPPGSSPSSVPPSRSPTLPAVTEHVQQVLPVPSGEQWWDQGAPEHTSPSSPSAPPPLPPARDLSVYLAQSIVAQCPRCGDFLLDVTDAPPGYHFGCRACGQRWEWQPGRPWPPVRVSPQSRGDRATRSHQSPTSDPDQGD